jgi:hypothetical protein
MVVKKRSRKSSRKNSKKSSRKNSRKKSRKSSRKNSNSCKKGQIKVKAHSKKGHSRRPYTKKNRKRVSRSYVDRAKVPAYCRKDVGQPGKTPKHKRILPKPSREKFSLVRMGYSAHKSDMSRRRVLNRAGKKHGFLEVLRHLNLRANYQKWNKDVYANMMEDVDYLGDQYADWKDKTDRTYGRPKSRRKSKRKSRKKR